MLIHRSRPISGTALGVLLVLVFQACKHEPQLEPLVPIDPGTPPPGGAACAPDTVWFQQQVLPLLVARCGSCHGPDDPEGGHNLTSYEGVMADDNIVRPFNLNRKLYRAITDTDPDNRMPPPPNAPLTQAETNLIRDWIMQGALNTSCASAGCDTLNVTWSGTIQPLIQSRCIGCHSGPGSSSGIGLTDWATVSSYAQNGTLASVVLRDGEFVPMPPSLALPFCDARKFMIWIADGAPNN